MAINFSELALPDEKIHEVRQDPSIVPVRKTKKHEWFRVRPGKEWEMNLPLYKAEEDEPYIVTDPKCAMFLEEQGMLQKVKIYALYIHGSGLFILSPVGLPDADGKQNSYHQTRQEAYEGAKTGWKRISANKALGAYDSWSPESDMGEPNWPKEPATLDAALNFAFEKRNIDSPEHPIIKRLKGIV